MTAEPTRTAWKAADAMFLLLFTVSVVVQANDADPFAWMAIYAVAALACILSLGGRLPWWFAVLVGLVAITWAATLAPRVLGNVSFLSMFEEFEMKDIGVEQSREMYGLLMTAAWMAILGHRSFRGRRSGRLNA